jgi:sensor domain CHASE-containing protein
MMQDENEICRMTANNISVSFNSLNSDLIPVTKDNAEWDDTYNYIYSKTKFMVIFITYSMLMDTFPILVGTRSLPRLMSEA